MDGPGEDLPEDLARRYEVVRTLGRGAFSRVVEVVDRRSGSRYALKLVRCEHAPERVAREIRVARAVDHPRVIPCHEGGILGDVAYLLLELAGGTLQGQIRDPAKVPATWRALCEVAEGLEALHAEGVVHRDVKPSNVLLTETGAKLGDLGLARDGASARLTHKGALLGTPSYMAPEQARGERVDAPGDVYSLAVLFYETLEGRLPYPEVPSMLLVLEIGDGKVLPFRRGPELVDPEALAVLGRALARDPAVRPTSLVALADFRPRADTPTAREDAPDADEGVDTLSGDPEEDEVTRHGADVRLDPPGGDG